MLLNKVFFPVLNLIFQFPFNIVRGCGSHFLSQYVHFLKTRSELKVLHPKHRHTKFVKNRSKNTADLSIFPEAELFD